MNQRIFAKDRMGRLRHALKWHTEIARAAFLVCGILYVCHVSGASVGSRVLYVDDSAPPGGDGSTWDNPLRHLQDALAIAADPSNDISDIHIGQGVYKPDQGGGHTPGDMDASFEVAGLAIRGGYAGFGAPDPEARDFKLFETVLSGDLLGNDGSPGTFLNYADNSIQVMSVVDPVRHTVLEGLTFTASQADGRNFTRGGGLACHGGSASIEHCTFRLNEAIGAGGAYFDQCDALLADCLFDRNVTRFSGSTGNGGGVRIQGGMVVLEDCDFFGNSSPFADGGGLYAGSEVIVLGCNFTNNSSDRGAGAVAFANSSFFDCAFTANNAACDGGGLLSGGTKVNCYFIDNHAGQFGAGVSGGGASINCKLIGNLTGFPGGGGGLAGGGVLINCEFRQNSCGGNSFMPGGGGAWVRSHATFVNCLFNGNESSGRAGAVFIDDGQTAFFVNCTLANNTTTVPSGAAVIGVATLDSSILWSNAPIQLSGSFDVQFTCVQGGWAGNGNITSNPQFVDALGLDGVPGTDDDNLRLASNSGCIDAGDNTALPADTFDLDGDGNVDENVPVDLDGHARVLNVPDVPNTGNPPNASAIVDMGCFEFADFRPVVGDVNDDGAVDVNDLLAVVGAWGNCPPSPQSCPADLDQNEIVNISDLLVVLQNWS